MMVAGMSATRGSWHVEDACLDANGIFFFASWPNVDLRSWVKRVITQPTVVGMFVRLALDFGMRVGEIARLQLDDIDWRESNLNNAGDPLRAIALICASRWRKTGVIVHGPVL
jgi:hypothetical protein